MKVCRLCGGSAPQARFRGGDECKQKGRRDFICVKCARAHKRDLRYELEEGEYERLVARCGGRCEICDEESELHVDHDHETGRVRGLLCRKCNMGIGCLGDSLAGLIRAVTYIERS